MPFHIGAPELILLVVIVLIVFGAGRLPDVFSQVGRGVRSFRTEAEGGAAEKREKQGLPPGRGDELSR